MLEYAGHTRPRQGVSGLHVHVGMPDGNACMRALEFALPWLPIVLALSANSPFLAGEDTGFSSNRGPILAELPRSGAPPAFASYEEWETYVERLMALELPRDYTAFWWDVRPHPRYGTLELRMPDQPTAARADRCVRRAPSGSLCSLALESPARDGDAAGRGLYAQNRWAAARFGPQGLLVAPDRDRLATAAELGAELLELVRPAAEALGSASLLEALDPERCEADIQREAGVEGAAASIAGRTLRSP